MNDITIGKSPAKLAHLVFKTRDKRRMLDWYGTVLAARNVFENDFIGFLTYDDEHHRVAVIEDAALAPPEPRASGLHHAAFTYEDLPTLLQTYRRLRDVGIAPAHAINHGPTTSIYYADPDGNRVELQVDNFPDMATAKAWFDSDEFRENPIGVDFDPEDLCARMAAGESMASLTKRPNIGPRGLPRR
jgi:catechol-2,3-dioxygenase